MSDRKSETSGSPPSDRRGHGSVAGEAVRYSIEEELGRGGMGTVYGAWDRTLKRKVAVKCPHPAVLQDREFLARFENEVRSLVNLTHPHIVRILDSGRHRGLPYVVMQYLAGGSLEDRVGSVQSAVDRLASLRQWLPAIAGALDFIHRKGFIHRDVKPGNVLFDESGHAYLGDFSIARVSYAALEEGGSQRLTQTGVVMGTPEYMAPELALANAYNGSVDQYALAVTVFEFLCGQTPYRGATPAAVLIDQGSKDVPLIHERVPWLTPRSSLILARALARDRWERFATCQTFADAFLASLPVDVAQTMRQESESENSTPDSAVHAAARLPIETQRHDAGTEPHVARQSDQTSSSEINRPNAFRLSSQHVVIALLILVVAFQIVGMLSRRTAIDESDDQWLTESVAMRDRVERQRPAARTQVMPEQLPVQEPLDEPAASEPVSDRPVASPAPPAGNDGDVSERETETPDATEPESENAALAATTATEVIPADTEASAAPKTLVTNSIGMTLRLIPGGQFIMGTSPASREFVSVFGSDVTDIQNEAPPHPVTLRPFYLGTHEVTLRQFQQFWAESAYARSLPSEALEGTGFDPVTKRLAGPDGQFQWNRTGFIQSDNHPVTNVSWHDAMAFCHWLGEKDDAVYRLPTEAEWEYACRAGMSSLFGHGNVIAGLNLTSNVADFQAARAVPTSILGWKPASTFNDNAVFTVPVGSYDANRQYLYDMHGNVSEWCMDWYDATYYRSSPVEAPPGPLSGTQRVIRGGSWLAPPSACRSASRSSRSPGARECSIGFRVVRLPDATRIGYGGPGTEPLSSSWPPAGSGGDAGESVASRSNVTISSKPSVPFLHNGNRYQMLARKDKRRIGWRSESPTDSYLLQYSVLDISQRQGKYTFQWKDTTTLSIGETGWVYEGEARTIRVRVAAVNSNGQQSDWTDWQGMTVIGSSIRRKDQRDAETLIQQQQFQWATRHINTVDNKLW